MVPIILCLLVVRSLKQLLLLSQFKPMTAGGHSSQTGFPVGYASYTASPSGFSASPAVTGGSRSGFEENKETDLYIPSQQVLPFLCP